MDDVLVLETAEKTQNEYGVWVETYQQRQIFCKVNSVTRTEFFEAGRNGLNPEYEFTVFGADYNGETVCAYNGNRYAIYRTYRVPGTDYMELYTERKGGTNG